MVDYTWVANLLRDADAFATQNNQHNLTNSVVLACAALLSDIEQRAQVSSEARLWLDSVMLRQDGANAILNCSAQLVV